MKLSFRIDYGNGPQTVTTDLWAVVAWERKNGTKVSQLGEGIGLDDLCFLAHNTLFRQGADVPKNLDDFIKQLEELEVVETPAVNPTRPVASAD